MIDVKTSSRVSVLAKNATLLSACLLTLATPLSAAAPNAKEPFDPNSGVRQAGLGTPTPLDKMIALDTVMGSKRVNWKGACNSYHVDVDPDKYRDKEVAIPAALGMRMSDGVLAIKAKDAEKLGGIATDIEALATKLNVPEEKLARAKKVRTHANRGEWPKVFLELGFLQNDVMKTLDEDGNKNRRAILISAGWLQGARSISGIVLDNFNVESAGLLREPLLVKTLKEDLEKVKSPARESVQVKALIAAMEQIFPLLDIPMHASPSKEDVMKINKISSDCIETLIKSKK